jgi:hypothetical protein
MGRLSWHHGWTSLVKEDETPESSTKRARSCRRDVASVEVFGWRLFFRDIVAAWILGGQTEDHARLVLLRQSECCSKRIHQAHTRRQDTKDQLHVTGCPPVACDSSLFFQPQTLPEMALVI